MEDLPDGRRKVLGPRGDAEHDPKRVKDVRLRARRRIGLSPMCPNRHVKSILECRFVPGRPRPGHAAIQGKRYNATRFDQAAIVGHTIVPLVLVANGAARITADSSGVSWAVLGDSMIPSVTRIVRLAFMPPDQASNQSAPEALNEAPLIEFVAYTDDCALAGLIRLSAERLTDLLNDSDEVELVDVVVESIRTGEVGRSERLTLPRSELVAIKAEPPRGNPARRRPSRQHPIAFGSGRYLLHGHLHTRPGADPLIDVGRRAPVIPLTDATIRFSLDGERRCDEASVLLVNRDHAEWVRLASEEEIAQAAYPSQTDRIAAFSVRLPPG
jgi:hypothetical protein